VAVHAPRTQVERSAAMQRRLLDAAVASLFEKGYGGTTTLEVQKRAGVSRGALLHHYASRSELMIAAVDHVAREAIAEMVRIAQAEAPADNRIEWAVRQLWSTFDGPLFTASLELWLAARNDADLLAALLPQERVLGHSIRGMATELFGPAAQGSTVFTETLELVMDGMRGAAARTVLRAPSQEERLISLWVELFSSRLASVV
jgi:AcrR family transcriptional regulator